MSDLRKWKVRGPVRTLRTEFAEWDLQREEWQPARYFTLVTFHPDGRIAQSDHHNPDGSVARSKFLYDENSRLTESQFGTDPEAPSSTTLYFYDDAGRQARTVQMNSGSTPRDIEVFTYDSRGLKTKVCFLTIPEPCSYGVEGTEFSYGASGATTMTVRYGETALPDEVLFLDARNSLVRRVSFERDAAGRLLKEELHFGEQSPWPELPDSAAAEALASLFGPSQTLSSTTYAYDPSGRVSERTTRMGSLSEDRDSFRYDDRGNTIEHTTEHEAHEVEIDEQGSPHSASEQSSRQHFRFEYRYDTFGNWTERVVWGRLEPNPDFQRSNIERREFTYHAV